MRGDQQKPKHKEVLWGNRSMSIENDKFLSIANSIKNQYIDEWKNKTKKVIANPEHLKKLQV